MLAPNQMPAQLHWFKWQNGVTWLTGISLLFVVYYMNGAAFLVNPAVPAVSPLVAIGISLGVILAAWAAYETLWTAFVRHPRVAAALSLLLLGVLAYTLALVFSGRAAYIHVGVILGSVMTGNVWTVILPSQKELIAATKAGRDQDDALAARAKQRSIHNNYMTFPLLFIMVSNHFPATYGNALNWVVLCILMVGSATVRHYMNIRFVTRRWLEPLLLVAAVTVAAVVALTLRRAGPAPTTAGHVSFAQVREIVTLRCRPCHASKPTDALFAVPPSGVLLETPAQIQAMAPRILNRAIVTKTMPFANRTNMTDTERDLVGRWIDEGARIE
jgi:uncharacterized membrane protein